MTEMEHFEYIVKPPEGYTRLRNLKIRLLIFYIAFAAAVVVLALLFVPAIIWPIIAAAAVGLLAAFVFFTWRLTRSEYEYSVDDGILTLSEINSRSWRKTLLELSLRDAELIAPTNGLYDAKLRDFNPEVSYSGVYTAEQANYFVLFTDEDNCRAVLYIFADTDAAKKFRRINGRTVVSFEKSGGCI